MSLISKINNIREGMHHDTKVKQIEGMGSRKARLTVKAAKRMVENMLDPKHPSPNPKGETDKVYLKESAFMMDKTMEKLKAVKDSRRKIREALEDPAELKAMEKHYEAISKVWDTLNDKINDLRTDKTLKGKVDWVIKDLDSAADDLQDVLMEIDGELLD